MEHKRITFDRFIRGIVGVVVVIALLMLLKRLSGVLLPFFIAWLVAYMVYPLVSFFQYRLRLRSRAVSIFCALVVVFGVLALLFYLLVPPILQELVRVKDLLVHYISGGSYGGSIPQLCWEFLQEHVDIQSLTQLVNKDNFMDVLKETLPHLWALLSKSFNLVVSVLALFIILLYLVFILLDYESIASGWEHLLPVKYRAFVVGLMNDLKEGMNRYFRGQALVALCVGILFCIGFVIIDFPLAIGLGIFIGVLNLVPYLQIVGILPTVALAILKAADTGGNFWVIIASAAAVFVVVQAIQDGLIVPRVMGRITGLNPAIILLSLSIWGSLLGVSGMIIALPLTTLMLSYYRRYIIGGEPGGKGEAHGTPTAGDAALRQENASGTSPEKAREEAPEASE
ncbi:MAG: AI-2E family transporter [Prevotellaceae bacterium]|nr:AI-2E family transporter [Prevotellaceae bacterium]